MHWLNVKATGKVRKIAAVCVTLAFIGLVLLSLNLANTLTQATQENERIQGELQYVAQGLDEVEASLKRIRQYGSKFDERSSHDLKQALGKKGISFISKSGNVRELTQQTPFPVTPDQPLRFSQSLGEDFKVQGPYALSIKERLNEMILESNLIASGIHQLAFKAQDRRHLLAAIPSQIPVQGGVSSFFGWRRSPFTGVQTHHNGIDLAASHGVPVYAAADGVVLRAGWQDSYGKALEIDHGYGIVTKYAHNSNVLLKEGEKVRRGQMIAKVGNTGRTTGAHLHYEVWINGRPVDPRPFLLEQGNEESVVFASASKESLHAIVPPGGVAMQALEEAGTDSTFMAGGIGGDPAAESSEVNGFFSLAKPVLDRQIYILSFAAFCAFSAMILVFVRSPR